MSSDAAGHPTRWLTAEEQAAWRGLLRMQAKLVARLHRDLSEEADLSFQDYGVLVLLSERADGRLRAFELGDELGWEKSRVSHHVARMAARGLVAREPCPSDHRGLFVTITPEGRQALTDAVPGHVESVRRAFVDRLTPGQLAALVDIAGAVLAGLSDHDAEQAGATGEAGDEAPVQRDADGTPPPGE